MTSANRIPSQINCQEEEKVESVTDEAERDTIIYEAPLKQLSGSPLKEEELKESYPKSLQEISPRNNEEEGRDVHKH